MIRYTLLALALAGVAGAAYAQAPLDPYGRPYVMSPPQPSPGDYTRERPGRQPMDQRAEVESPYHGTMRHREAFRDEYGFRYDERGDRIDAYGRVISPHTTTP